MTRRTHWNPNPVLTTPAEKVLIRLEVEWEHKWRVRYHELLEAQLPGHVDNEEINSDPELRAAAHIAYFVNCVWEDRAYLPLAEL